MLTLEIFDLQPESSSAVGVGEIHLGFDAEKDLVGMWWAANPNAGFTIDTTAVFEALLTINEVTPADFIPLE